MSNDSRDVLSVFLGLKSSEEVEIYLIMGGIALRLSGVVWYTRRVTSKKKKEAFH